MNLTLRPFICVQVRDRSQNEPLNGSHISSRKLGPTVRVTLDIYSVQPTRRPAQTTRGFLPRSCISPTDVRTVSRVRARETESYREWRVSGEISKFPFNGIIKRSGVRDSRGGGGRTCDHVTFGKLVEIPRGLKGKLSRWQREMTADFRYIVTNHGMSYGKNIVAI